MWCIVRADARAEDGELNHLEGIGARGADIWYLYFIGDAGLGDGRAAAGPPPPAPARALSGAR